MSESGHGQAPAVHVGDGFDPTRYLMKVRGGQEYLEVKWRLVWLRQRAPNARIDTTLLEHHPGTFAVVKAVVSLPDGASASGLGSETSGDFGDYLEKAECVPLTVRALTRNGWVYYHQLHEGDEVLGFNQESRTLEWTTVLGVKTFDDQPLVQIGNSRFTAIATPNHRWVTSAGLLPWNEIPNKASATITLAGCMGDRGGAVRTAAQLGWIFTDGHIQESNGLPTRATITQSKEEHFAELTELFGEPTPANNAPVREWGGDRVASPVRPAMLWSIGSERLRAVLGWFRVATMADLPRAVLSMTFHEADAFLGAAMRADGSGGVFAKTHLPVVEAVQMAMFLTGHCTGPIQERAGNEMTTKPCFTVSQQNTAYKYLSEFTERKLPPQPVWCPTTTLDTWVADFNGRFAITGNTKAIGRALAGLGFGTQFTNDYNLEQQPGQSGNQRLADAPVEFASTRERRLADNGGGRPRSSGGGDGVSEKQIGLIERLARETGIVTIDFDLTDTFGRHMQVHELTKAEASRYIDRLQALRAQGGDPPPFPPASNGQAAPDVDDAAVAGYLTDIENAKSIFALDDIGNELRERGITHDGLRAAFRTKKLLLTGGA